MQEHDSGNEVEAQEHGHAQHHVQVGLRLGRRVGEGQPRPPLELNVPGDGMHRGHQQLQSDQQDPLHRHGDAPVVRSVVDNKQLRGTGRTRGELSEELDWLIAMQSSHHPSLLARFTHQNS